MATGPRKRAQKREEAGDTRPDWRSPPARTRKRKRHYPAVTGEGAGGARHGSGRKAGATIRLPSRAVLLSYVRSALFVVLAGAVAYGMFQLLRLPQLAVSSTSTQIGGAQRIPPSRIFVASQAEGRNIFVMRADEIAQKVQALPGIARAEVHLRLPNQLIVDVVENAPLVAWQGITTTVWLSENGREVPQAGDPPPLTLIDETETDLESSKELWPLVLKSLADLHAADATIHELRYGRAEGLYYRAASGTAVWLGDSGAVRTKLALISAAQREIASTGTTPKVIDVRLSGEKALYW